MDRRAFLLSSLLSSLHCGAHPGLKWALQNTSLDLTEELRSKLAHDSLRPQYHLLPEGGFVSDPCAPRFFNGQYHMFFHGSFGGRGWHHAISSDLVHWRHMPVALAPTENSYDSYGTFTGSVLPGEDFANVIYTGVTKAPREQETIRNEGLKEVQCIAFSNDPDLRTWRKLEMPIIEAPPSGKKIVGFRDPFAWKDGDIWYAGVGSGFEHEGGAVLLYRSKDGRHWEYLHPLAQGVWNGKSFSNPVPSGEMWECPDFFVLGDKHVLLYSTENKTFWEVGTFDRRELRFHSQSRGMLDHGSFYAPKSMIDGQNRRILWGWVQETRAQAEIENAGWSGAISLPRILTIGSDNELHMEVAPELTKLHQNLTSITSFRDIDDLKKQLAKATIRSMSGHISYSFRTGKGAYELELGIGVTTAAKSILALSYAGNRTTSLLIEGQDIPLHPDVNGVSSIDIWVDGSIIEIFVDSKQALTLRKYVALPDSSPLSISWHGNPNPLLKLTMCAMAPISGDRLTS